MKIAHVTSGLVRKAAGVREVVLGLARAQRASGVDAAVLRLEHSDWPAERYDWDGIPTRAVSVLGPRRLGMATFSSEVWLKHLHSPVAQRLKARE